MRKVHNAPAPINTTTTTPPSDSPPPDDSLFIARNKLLEACALITALADALSAIPADQADESHQALANVCERACREAFEAIEKVPAPSRNT